MISLHPHIESSVCDESMGQNYFLGCLYQPFIAYRLQEAEAWSWQEIKVDESHRVDVHQLMSLITSL